MSLLKFDTLRSMAAIALKEYVIHGKWRDSSVPERMGLMCLAFFHTDSVWKFNASFHTPIDSKHVPSAFSFLIPNSKWFHI